MPKMEVHSSSKTSTMNVEPGQTQVIIVHHINHDGKLDNHISKYVNKKCLYYFTLSGVLICALLILSTLAVVIVKYSKKTSNQNSTEPTPDAVYSVKVISRKEWMAEPPSSELPSQKLPVSRVIIAHTATDNCTTQADCSIQVKNIQKFHIESDFEDIGYNFLIGGDGAVYVGRGWPYAGAHTRGFNNNSICFAFIGTFNAIKPPERQRLAAQKMMLDGIRLKKLTADYKLYGHNQFMETASPGKALYEIIKTWDHWTKTNPK